MSFRPLATYEKKLLSQSLDNQTNGTIVSAKYSIAAGEDLSDDATLLTNGEPGAMMNIIIRALEKLVYEHPELYTTINDQLEFEPVQEIRASEIISAITFDSIKDEFVNCHLGAPPYLLRHIFNRNKFQPGSGKPLWELYVVDESLVIFHGSDMLFDIYAASNFHKLFFQALNYVPKAGESVEIIFKRDQIFQHSAVAFPNSIYDNPLNYFPAKTLDLVHLQTQSFFKSVFNKIIKKSFNYLTFNSEPMNGFKNKYGDFLDASSPLCGTTVFGNISTDRFDYLNSIAQHENVCTKSLICGLAMLALKPIIKDFTSSITFSITVNLRSHISDSSEFGLCHKNIRVECPLSMIDDNVYKNLNIYNGYDSSSIKVHADDPSFEDKAIEYQFKQISDLVSSTMKQRMRSWRRCGFNDDDIKRMKFAQEEKLTTTKVIQINDVSEFSLDSNNGTNGVSVRELSLTHSLSSSEFMSMSFSQCKETGTNICIHYPDSYNMENFVERFQQFIEDEC